MGMAVLMVVVMVVPVPVPVAVPVPRQHVRPRLVVAAAAAAQVVVLLVAAVRGRPGGVSYPRAACGSPGSRTSWPSRCRSLPLHWRGMSTSSR